MSTETPAAAGAPQQGPALVAWLRRIFGAAAAASAGSMLTLATIARDSPETLKLLKDMGPLCFVLWIFASYLKLQHDANEREKAAERAMVERRFAAMEAAHAQMLNAVLSRDSRLEKSLDRVHRRLDGSGAPSSAETPVQPLVEDG